jgi:hypothetical protein
MAYLISRRSPSNLGAYRRVSPVPVHPGQRAPIVARPPRFQLPPQFRIPPVRVPRIGTRPQPPARFLLGQDPLAPGYAAGEAATGTTPVDVTGSIPLDTSSWQPATTALMPTPLPTNYPPLPAQINANYTAQPMSLDPLNFVSPQAAIAAGADPQKTAAAWTKAVASFPSANAAVAAGIPAGVVTQLWAASRSVIPPPSGSWFDGSTFGIPNKFFAFGAGGIMLLAVLGGKRRR